MKIDKFKLKRSVNDLPQSCRDVIQLFKSCPDHVLLAELQNTITWNFGKSELYHWIDVLNRFDQILSECTQLPPENPLYEPENIYLVPDIADPQKRELVLQILSFTALLIENANARHTYCSMEHLIALLTSNDLDVVLASLNVIFVFSKRCHYISRLPTSQRNALTNRLIHLAESMGGKESGFGLCKLSEIRDMLHFPASATSVHFEFARQSASEEEFVDNNQTIQLDNLYNFTENPQQILQHVLKTVTISRQKQSHLLYRIQRAMHFPNFSMRCQCIEAQLMAKSILIYSAFVPDFIQTSVEQGLIEELVELLEVDSDDDVIMKLKAACFRNLTALLQQEREPRSCPIINKIISAMDCQNYYGILASLVRKIIKSMTEMNVLLYSQAFITTLFSFLYHMAINETSATALIASGHIEFLIQVISWKTDNPLNVSLVTRAVRVIDLLSTLDIQPTQAKSICDMLFERLEMEMKICKRDAPYELPAVSPKEPEGKEDTSPGKEGEDKSSESKETVKVEPMDLEEPLCTVTPEELQQHLLEMRQSNLQCLPQRSALIKSLLNFFKKAASDLFFPETLRNLCESPLLPHLKHIISNVEYYGPTLYLPATEIVTNHILNEPSHLTPLQMTGLPGVVLNSLLFKPIPPTVDILTALPNMLSALCLNERGLNVFLQAQPFDRLFSILITPEYLSAMRKRKNVESSATGFDATPAVLGSSMDQLMRHQPALRKHVFDSLIKLLERILDYGTEPDWIITPSKGDSIEDDMSYYSEEPDDNSPTVSENVTLEKLSNQLMEKSRHIPLIDYILNVIRFISHIIANKSYNDDHLNEFQQRGGLSLLLKILCMPNLPLDFSNSQALTVILSSIKQIVEFMKNPQEVLELILSQHLSQLLDTISPLYETSAIGLKSVLMSCSQTENLVSTNSLLHRMCITQHFISLLANMHKTNNEAKFIKYLSVWIKDDNTKLILKQLSFLHNSLFWESALLLNEPVTPHSLISVTCPAKERERLIPDVSTPVIPTNSTEASVEVVVDKKPPSSLIKKLKPCFHVIRHLGSNLTDLFTHLVRFACNTPGIRNKISRNAKVFLHDNCVEMVKVLIEILKDKLLWQPNFQDSKYGRDILHLVRSCLIISSSNFLFDERKQPYLLMLSEFEKAGGFHVLVQLYEQSFSVITQPCQDANMLTFPTISCDKWLSAWLNFVEKLLNINLVLHSQNIILPFKPTPSEAQNQPVKCYQFEPTTFLINAQQVFIEPLKASWKLLNNLNCSGSLALLEPHLTILCGLIQGENILRERLELVSKKAPAQAPTPEVFSPSALHVEKLTEMGFTSQQAGKALESCNNNIAQALDWLMNHPVEAVMEGLTEDDQMAKAIALSLDGQPKEEPQETPLPELLNLRDDPEFIDDVISCCAHLLKKIPQAVYRIVPLFTVITVNWGPSYIEPSLHLIFKEFYETATLLQESPLNSPIYQHLYSLVLLLIFLFENLTYNTLTCTSGSPIQDHCINLFGLAVQQLQNDPTTTIEWLSPLILFIDLLEKHSQIIIHREPRPKELFYWSWMNSGRWTNFLQANSKLINKAFSEGASSVTVPLEKNNRCIISFDNMTMRGLEPHAQSIQIRYSKIPDAPKEDSPAPTSSDSETEVVSKVVPESHGDHVRELASALALNYDQKVRLITSCATILQFVKNTSLLQAVLQLSIRLTRDYRMALIFGECKGYIHLFSFKKDMLFSGFQALTSILIRHLFESENALRYMMESAIRISHHYPSPSMSSMPYRMGRRSRNTKDLDALFRSISPIYNKHPEIFMEIAKEVFRLDDSDHPQLFAQESRKLDIVKLLPRKKPYTTLDNENQEAFIRDLLELLYHGNDPADSSTATNPLLLGNSLPFDPLFPRSSNMIRQARNRFNPFDRLHGNFLRGDTLRSFQLQVNNMMDMVDEDMDIDEFSDMQPLSFQMPSPLTTAKANPSEQAIVSKSGILRLLAELVTSYPMCANFICQEKLPRNGETTALTYILDNLIHESKVAKSFLRTIGGLVTSNFPDVQILLITELKQAIIRVSQLPECQLKHIKLRALLGLINTFLVVPGKGYTLNIAKSMVKRNFASDLAKVLHSLDLNSPDLPETANNIIRTIEALTKLLYNTPGHQNQVKKVIKTTTTDSSRGDQTAGVEANADAQPTTSNGDQASNSDPIELADTANASGDATLIEHSMEDPSYNEMMIIELSNIIKSADGQENEGGDNAGVSDTDSTSSDRTGDSETDESMDDTEELREDPDNCNSAGEELDNYDCLDEAVVGERLDSNDVRVVISLGASQNMGADDLQHSSIEDDDPSIDLNVTSPHDITEDPDNTVADDLDDDDADDQPPSDVLLGSSSSNEEHEIHNDVEIESDVSQDSDAETEEMSEVVTIMGQSYDYDSSADLEDLDLQDDLFPILRRQYSINRNLFRESMFPGIQRTHNTNRIPAHPLLNRQTNRPPQQSSHQPLPTQPSSYSLRVSDPQSVLQLVSSSRSTTLPEPGARPLPGQWRRLVLEQDQLVFEEDPLLHKEQNIESQDNEDEGFIPMCNLRIHQEDGILGSCHNFQSIKKAQEEIAVFLRVENEKERKKQESKDCIKVSKEGLMKDIFANCEKDILSLPSAISPPPLPLPEALPLSNISIPSPSEQLPVSNLLEPSAEQPNLPTQLPTDSPLLFNQFDGSRLSARQTLQQIDSNHPLYTFFSAVAGHPPPPNPLIPISSSATGTATSLSADTSTVQHTAPPTVTTMDRPREGPAGDTSHVPPDTNLPLGNPPSIPMHGVSDVAVTPEQSAANIFTPITPIYPYQELPGSAPPVPSEAPTTSGEPVPDTNSQTGQENVVPPPPALSGPTLLRSIDPDFLAAIPETLRVEIIREEQELRTVLRDRTTAPPNASGRQRHELDHVHGEISTEVLAEMPADIQDEIISQRRIEQQRQNLITSDDPCSFLNTLPSALRQTVLNEMDEETFGNLPSDVQEEATHRHRPRHRDYAHMFESRQMLTDPLQHYDLLSIPSPSFYLRRFEAHNIIPPSAMRRRGMIDFNLLTSDPTNKPPLDFEALTCLLSVLFLDTSKIQRQKYNQLIRLLCEHKETKNWILSILTYFLADINQISIPDCSIQTAPPIVIQINQSNTGQYTVKEEPMLEDQHKTLDCISITPQPKKKSSSWMSITQTCGSGLQNILQLETPSGKGSKPAQLHLHTQAQNTLNNNILDAFLQLFAQTNFMTIGNQNRREIPSMMSKYFLEPTNSALLMHSKFWECLIKLESSHVNSKGKASNRTHVMLPNLEENSNGPPLVHMIINLLECEHIRSNQPLLDKFIKLLWNICQNLKPPSTTKLPPNPAPADLPSEVTNVVIPNLDNQPLHPPIDSAIVAPLVPISQSADSSKKGEVTAKTQNEMLFSNDEVNLVIGLLSCKSCDDQSLNNVNQLVMKLAKYHRTIMKHIYSTLVSNCKQIGLDLQTELQVLKDELVSYNTANPISSEEAKLKANKNPISFYTLDQQKVSKSYRPDLHLPSMSPFLSKTSNVSLFLRMLKILQMLRKEIQMLALGEDSPFFDWDNGFDMPPQHSEFRDRLRRDMRTHVQELTERSDQVAEQIQGYMQVLNEDPDSFDDHSLSLRTEAIRHGMLRRQEERGVPSTSRGKRDPADQIHSTPLIKKRDSYRLSQVLSLPSLWALLEDCLEALAMSCHDHAVLVMQNMVECFFIVHAGDKDNRLIEEPDDTDMVLSRYDREGSLASLSDLPTETSLTPVSPSRSVSSQSPKEDLDMAKFLKFADCHRVVLNQILRQTTTPLSSGTFSILIDHTRLLDFDVKREYFRQELEATSSHSRREDMIMQINRKTVFEDSFRQLSRKSPEEMKNKLYVIFKDEDGQDAGGLLREWYLIVSREIFNPDYALFTTTPGDKVTYVPNSCSYVNHEHLDYFKFVGRLIAKAIYDNKLLDCYFGRSFYKHILSKPVQYTDLESEDYGFYKSMLYLMEHNLNEIGCELTFSTEIDEFGKMEIKDLVKNGRDLPVTEQNKKDYVRLVCQMKMTGAIHKQIKSFLEGFYEIIPKKLISIFNEQELELLISGLPNIDIDDLKANTEYYKYNETSIQIQWFWRALRSFEQADRAKFLQFVTGTSKVPLRGFAYLEGMNGSQKFQIHKDERSDMRLPSAHTCFNQLDLPAYNCYEDLRSNLLYASQECPEGFGLA